MALGIALLCLSAAHGGGLTQRPLNLTCVAPPAPTSHVELLAIDSPVRATLATGHEAGVFYRGQDLTGMDGAYLYVDATSGALIARRYPATGHGHVDQTLVDGSAGLRGIGETADGEVLVATDAGAARLGSVNDPLPASFPATLSATGCVDVNDASVPAPGLIPYAPSATLWSDGAAKRRWIAMPDWLAPDTTITVLGDGDFEFPIGTVLIKEFAIGALRVETRLLVHHDDGSWGGYSYEWNDEQTDALLLDAGKVKDVAGQTWTFPANYECMYCHSAASNRSLGPEIAQLNHDFDYGADGIGNQLETFDAIGLIAGGLPGPVASLDALPAYDSQAPLADRARGYLHANCANCHRPGGPGIGPEDFRYQLDGTQIGALDVLPTRGDLGVPGARLLRRGAPLQSILYLRMQTLDFTQMPPLGVSIVDPQANALIAAWIASGSGFGFADGDADEYSDDLDNCSALANPDQRDTDGDGYGNACDADLNNDGIINVVDLGLLRLRFFSADPDADFNGDGQVNVVDLGIMRVQFFGPPGPGAVPL